MRFRRCLASKIGKHFTSFSADSNIRSVQISEIQVFPASWVDDSTVLSSIEGRVRNPKGKP